MPQPLMCDKSLFSIDLSGKVYVVTGANSGIGRITAEQLIRQGAHVVLACRNLASGAAAERELRAEHPGAKVEVGELDLGSLASVQRFATEFQKAHTRLDGLVNNAGVMNTPKGTTRDGFETQFGTNHLGHFYLTELLLETLKATPESRIVNLSSCYHDLAMGREGKIHFDDLNYTRRKYDGWEAYAQSKLANLLHAQELALRLAGSGVTAVSVHPGWVRTNLIRHSLPVFVQNGLGFVFRQLGMIEPWEGAQTSLYALLSPEVPQHNGAFFSQTGRYRDPAKNSGGWPLVSPNPEANKAEVRERLWVESERLIQAALAQQKRAA